MIASGVALQLKYLDLTSLQIGSKGLKALADALGKEGSTPRLEGLYLNHNQIGNEGLKALAAALKEGAAPSLKVCASKPCTHNEVSESDTFLCACSAQVLTADRRPPELVSVCEERGIELASRQIWQEVRGGRG